MSGQGAEIYAAVSSMSYAGDKTPQETWEALQAQQDAQLIDVRTHEERIFVGEPDLTKLSKSVIALPWRLYPTMAINENFISKLEALKLDRDTPLYFLCKVGGRSADAAIAATEAGWTAAYNILDGFEGAQDECGHRSNVSGWKASKLPWRQN